MRAWILATVLLGASATTLAQTPAAESESGSESESESESGSESGSESESESGSESESESESESAAPAAKVAVVVAGDPDDALRAAASRLDDAVQPSPLGRPADPALRAALRGESPPATEDGLERLRRERRGLGFGDDDRPRLARLGGMAGADVLLVVSRREGTLGVEVFDVHAARFFRDRLSTDPGEVLPFARRAARSARRRVAADRPEEPVAERGAEPVEAPSATETAEAAVADPDERDPAEPPSPARAWFKKNWALILAGALLVGVVTGFVLRARRDEPPLEAVILFRPGE